jgi:lysozyme family protein
MQAFAQDMAFNRGLGGATRYFQQGLNSLGVNVNVDGSLGPKTLQAISQVQPQALMRAASEAQLRDEYAKAEQDPRRNKFIPGLEARIRNRLSAFGQG